ncbi:MAG: helix-turn-helix domain-containing protein [Gemmatimonadaceae bacterium]
MTAPTTYPASPQSQLTPPRGALSDFVAWDGGCLLIGTLGGLVPPHAHYAIQIAFGSVPGIRFRSGGEPWTTYGGAMIPSRQPHEMDSTALPDWAIIFVEPETRVGRALTERWLGQGIAAMPADVLAEVAPPLFSAWRDRRDANAVRAAAQDVVAALVRGTDPVRVPDERILRAVAYIKSHLDAPLTLEEVAAEACLSPSRFRHLFVEQTGMALRPYILWRRFLRVWELIMGGATLSSAAHAAGFADAAHLTRTSRRMFGIPPSVLQTAGRLH